ncbi:MAG TPA: hypothetical protein VK986_22265 [Tepidisphaeraceae bacterium]|nr:hypothetical protein [Tepidisphaeraceae bacterium]
MKHLSMRSAALVTFAAVLFAPASRAEDMLLSATAPLAKPRKTSDRSGPADRVEFSIYVPGDVKTLRGAVMNPFHLKTAEQEHWRQACRTWGFALIGANYFGVGKEQFAGTLQAALDNFATRSGHPELRHVPLCFVGMSAGAGMSREFASALPDRTLAVAAVCLEVAPDTDALRGIPFLNVFGEKDGGQMKLHLEKLPVQRARGARWGIAVQWGRKHEFALANNLVVPFFEDVIALRLPPDADLSKGPAALRPVPPDSGWLGDVTGWADKRHVAAVAPVGEYKGDAAVACWFPSARVAATWRALVTADPGVRITEPAGLGDNQPFQPQSTSKPVTVRVVLPEPGAAKVELFDGDKLLASKTAAPFAFEVTLEPGSHPLIAVAHPAGGGPAYSRPHTVIVVR